MKINEMNVIKSNDEVFDELIKHIKDLQNEVKELFNNCPDCDISTNLEKTAPTIRYIINTDLKIKDYLIDLKLLNNQAINQSNQ